MDLKFFSRFKLRYDNNLEISFKQKEMKTFRFFDIVLKRTVKRKLLMVLPQILGANETFTSVFNIVALLHMSLHLRLSPGFDSIKNVRLESYENVQTTITNL